MTNDLPGTTGQDKEVIGGTDGPTLTIEGDTAGIDEADLWEIEPPNGEFIAAAFNALGAIDCIDATMMGKDIERKKKLIIKRCIDIIDNQIEEIHNYLFPVE